MASSAPNTGVKSVLCNSNSYSKGDPFAISLAYVLAELETTTPARKGYDFYNISPYPNAFAFGHANCSSSLTRPDCKTCLGAAKTAMLGSCDGRIGARAVLNDCSVSTISSSSSDCSPVNTIKMMSVVPKFSLIVSALLITVKGGSDTSINVLVETAKNEGI
ncbi:unnamed protein product [Fraxinus pennsylvanica]|uniref:Gnk2-homologous domain-containing protein n=1 Tax=Fraxinus pennsylvanica TaxID=56036 RepID=A0AAD2ACI0_9LAMI|nr:unnamed protein product [Fraxinus pennsylvanica]